MYSSAIELGMVALNVSNLDLQSLFYQQVLGMKVLKEKTGQIDLGVSETTLVRLIETADQTNVKQAYGLYHLAIVLPSREDLGQIFRHFLTNQVPLVGASDHGYSEAIYLEDTEGNGIEIYRDLPEETWDVREDGQVIGITEAMDAQAVFDAGSGLTPPYQMPEGSRMGHVHLSVKNSKDSSNFYQTIFDMDEKFGVPSASWLASGTYHHHLAVNEWAGPNQSKRSLSLRGLAYFEVVFSERSHYSSAILKAKELGIAVQESGNMAIISDRDGINIRLLHL